MRDSQSGGRPSTCTKFEGSAIGGGQGQCDDDRLRCTGGETGEDEGQSCGIAGQTRNPHETVLTTLRDLARCLSCLLHDSSVRCSDICWAWSWKLGRVVDLTQDAH